MEQHGETLLSSSGVVPPAVPPTDPEMLMTGRTLHLFPDCGRGNFILPLSCTIWMAFPTLFWTLLCVGDAVYPWTDSVGLDVILVLSYKRNPCHCLHGDSRCMRPDPTSHYHVGSPAVIAWHDSACCWC